MAIHEFLCVCGCCGMLCCCDCDVLVPCAVLVCLFVCLFVCVRVCVLMLCACGVLFV